MDAEGLFALYHLYLLKFAFFDFFHTGDLLEPGCWSYGFEHIATLPDGLPTVGHPHSGPGRGWAIWHFGFFFLFY